ncbi:hypothetical protein A2U01_0111516, partial [Trifolium medium]|nr:hypothetical protein [Trifolium medium]
CLVAERASQRAKANEPVLEWSLSEPQREIAMSSLILARNLKIVCHVSPFLASRR